MGFVVMTNYAAALATDALLKIYEKMAMLQNATAGLISETMLDYKTSIA